MTRLPAPPAGARRGPFRPSVEALEDRCVPTANFIVQGNTLLVVAPASRSQVENERIVINDNGGSGPNNVTAFARANFFPNVPIKTVVVMTGRGADNVSYNLAGDLGGQRTIIANLGGGNDSFTAFLRRNLLPGSNLGIIVNGGSGDDRLQADMIGNVGAGAVLNMAFNGAGGSNVLSVFSATSLRVDPGAVVGINLIGGGHDDRIFADFFGTINGSYTLLASGGGGSNRITGQLEVAPGSAGRVVGSQLLGGPGNDTLTFTIHAPVGFQADNQLIDGGPGFDTSIRTTNVISLNCERDFIVP